MKKETQKYFVTGAIVIASVVGAGYLMYEFRDNSFVKKARNGFQGIA